MLPMVNTEKNKELHLPISIAQRVELLQMVQCGVYMKHVK